MKRKISLTLSVVSTLLLFSSCSDESINPNQDISSSFKEGMTVLGKEINDPYSLGNMKLAAQKLKEETGSRLLDDELQPTHVYLRFLPKDEEEWDVLKRDTTVILFDYPLNYELEVEGTYYHDPSLPATSITWQYTVLPIDYEIPPIQHEVLYEVFIPEIEEVEEGQRASNEMNELYAQLEIESFRLTGNIPEEVEETDNGRVSCWLCPDRWHPKGKIRVFDNVVNDLIPLVGAEVHARWSTRIERDLTDANGDFSMGGFIYEVNYSIKWERANWDIRNGAFGQAWFNGPKKKGDWNLDIVSGESLRYATIHRAALRYFYGNNLGLRRPNGFGKIKIAYKDVTGTGDYLGNWDLVGVFPDIRIYGKESTSGNYKTTNIIFGTTAHELGHASHMIYLGLNRFANQNKLITESWADAIEWGITELEYTDLGNRLNNTDARNYIHERRKWSWPTGGQTWEYSPIFRDLVDSQNQRNNFTFKGTNHFGSVLYPDDRVTGFSLRYIEDNILPDSYGTSSLRDRVKAKKVSGVTDANIDLLFNLYW